MQTFHESIIIGHVHLATLPDSENPWHESSEREHGPSEGYRRGRLNQFREWLAAVEDAVTPPHWLIVFTVVWIMYLTLLHMSIQTLVGNERLVQIGKLVLLEWM